MRGLASMVENGGRVGTLAFALALSVCVFPPAAGAIPPGRAYEMVSPVYKAGYGANGLQAEAPNGESVVFRSLGVFAGEQWAGGSGTGGFYLARRGSSSWETEAATWSATVAPGQGTGNIDFSSDLGSMDVLLTTDISSSGEQHTTTESKQEQFWSRSLASPAEYGPLAPTIEKADKEPPLNLDYIDSSADLSHLIVQANPGEVLLEAAEGALGSQLYEFVTTRGGGPELVAVDKMGALLSPDCTVNLGVEVGGSGSSATGQRPDRFNAVSRDGEMVFFTVETSNGAQCEMPELFARVAGADTLQVSKSVAADCTSGPCRSAREEPAYFEGANEAGSRVFFTTTQPLVTGDTDASNDLYMATIGCRGASSCEPAEEAVVSLTQVSRSANAGEAAEVQNVVAVSPDGSRAYFVARGALDGANAEGLMPIGGADNLYAEEIGKPPVFVTALCSGPERSGTVKDSRCPVDLKENDSSPGALDDNPLWASAAPEAQTAGSDAGALAFASYGRLVVGDANDAKDIYLYNAAAEKLIRVSIGEEGFDANGNGHRESSGGEAEITRFKVASETGRYWTEGLVGRTVSEDGSRVIFTTGAPLSSAAVNGLRDLYEWRAGGPGGEGSVSLLSSGDATEPVGVEPAISPSGRDVFFVTNAILVPQDTEGADDVYDARIGGGFPAPLAPSQPCSGDACQGPLTNPAPLLVPGSASQAPGENISVSKKKTVSKKKASCRAKFKHVKNQQKRNRQIRRCLLHRKVKHSAHARRSAQKTSRGRGRR